VETAVLLVVVVAVLLAAVALVMVWRGGAVGPDSRRYEGLWDRLDKLEADRESDRELVAGLRGQIQSLEKLTDVLMGWVQLLRNELILHDIAPPQEIPADVAGWRRGRQPSADVVAPALLARTLEERFSLQEMNTLIFDLGVAVDEIRGETTPVRARALVRHFERRGRLGDLVALVCELRGDVLDWC